MLSRLALSAVCCSALLAAQDPIVKTGPHFRVFCHFPDDAVADQALETVEAVWPVAGKLFGGTRVKPEQALEVHLYRDAEAFEQAVGGDELMRVDDGARAAHAALQPLIEDSVLLEVGLTYMTRRTLARLAAELARIAMMPNAAHHPHWFIDGTALWIECETMRAQKRLTEPAADPYFSTCMIRNQLLQRRTNLPTPDEILAGKTSDLEDHEDRRAVRWMLVEFLQQKKTARKFAKAITALKKLGDDASDSDRVAKLFAKQVRTDLLEKPFEKFVKDSVPLWNQQSGSLEVDGKGWLQLADKESSAFAWAKEDAGHKPYSITGKVSIMRSTGGQMNLLVGGGGGFLMITFTEGKGVMLWEYKNAGGGTWDTLGQWPDVPIAYDTPTAFEVDWHRKGNRELALTVDGKEVFRQKLIRAMNGAYGVGAQAAAAGRWHDLKIER